MYKYLNSYTWELGYADQYRDRRRTHSEGGLALWSQDQAGSGRGRAANVDPRQGTGRDPEPRRKGPLAGGLGRKPAGPRSAVILVDTSVWIGHLNDAVTGPVSRLRELIPAI